MKNIWMTLVIASMISSSFAQTVTSTYTGSGTMDLTQTVAKPVALAKLDAVPDLIKKEESSLMKLENQDLRDPCLTEELLARKADLEFLKKHSAQIQDVANQIKSAGIRLSRFLRNASEGRVNDLPLEKYTNSSGQADQSVMIRIKTVDESGAVQVRTIPVKELMKFIAKFEAEVASLGNDPAAVSTLMKKYDDTKNLDNSEFFNLNLSLAARAFSRNLNSVLAAENDGLSILELKIGTGKYTFQVMSSIGLGYSPKFKTHTGSLGSDASSFTLTFAESVQDSIERTRKEEHYWEMIRKQKLTIDGVPIDGALRREYFEKQRSEKCVARSYTFDISKSEPGPWLSFDARIPCEKKGIEIISARFDKTADYKVGSTVKKGSTVNVAPILAELARGKSFYQTDGTLGDVLSSTGLGYNDGGRLSVTYTCACEKKQRSFNNHYKLSMSVSISCQ